MFKLKDYQLNAIENLKKYFKFRLQMNDKNTIVFKAPTGSGKTIMASSLITNLIEENHNENMCFIWASIGWAGLHEQSFNSVKEYTEGNPVCSLLDDEFFGTRKFIKRNEVVFINWEKLVSKDNSSGEWKNVLMKDREGFSFLDVLNKTRKNGTKLVLIIDEAHRGSQSLGTRIAEFKNTIIEPDITFELSATPLGSVDVDVTVDEVIEAGMIKKEVVVNEGINEETITSDEITSEITILQKGFDKRFELEEEYSKINSEVKPLCLIQIPNSTAGDSKLSVILDFLRERNITVENDKLFIWTNGNSMSKQERKNIKKFNSSIEFIVFKTAVATGWDCPRAQILVKFREGSSESFEIQTIGRILRMPEAKAYNNSLLDAAYIYTNLSNFVTSQQTYSPNTIKTEIAYFRQDLYGNSIYKNINLKSHYRSREGDYNSADSNFYKFFDDEFKSNFNITENDLTMGKSIEKIEEKGIKINLSSVDGVIIESKMEVKSIDENQKSSSKNVNLVMSESDIENYYYQLIKNNLSGLAYVRSKSTISAAIMNTFSSCLPIYERKYKVVKYQRDFLNNKEIFEKILSNSTQKFKDFLVENSGKKGIIYDFEIESKKSYSKETFKKISSKLSLYQPLYVRYKEDNGVQRDNYLEASFINLLDNNEKIIEWFWQNGAEQMKTNFGISYNNGLSTFYPDFIIKYKDGSVGIYDTKPIGERVEDTKLKAEALQKYIKEENLKRENIMPKLCGGIIIATKYDSVIKTYSNFKINSDENYVDFKESTMNWNDFEFIIRKGELN